MSQSTVETPVLDPRAGDPGATGGGNTEGPPQAEGPLTEREKKEFIYILHKELEWQYDSEDKEEKRKK